jgi:hypothetical protein
MSQSFSTNNQIINQQDILDTPDVGLNYDPISFKWNPNIDFLCGDNGDKRGIFLSKEWIDTDV